MAHLHLVTLVVGDYDRAITFFRDVLDFDLVEDVPSTTNVVFQDLEGNRWDLLGPAPASGG